jgi:hypothetical protein
MSISADAAIKTMAAVIASTALMASRCGQWRTRRIARRAARRPRLCAWRAERVASLGVAAVRHVVVIHPPMCGLTGSATSSPMRR